MWVAYLTAARMSWDTMITAMPSRWTSGVTISRNQRLLCGEWQGYSRLNAGMRPLVKPLSPDEDRLDIVLREIAEGKLIAEVDFDALTRLGMME